MLGLPKGEVFLVPWTEEWEKEFHMEKEKIHKALIHIIVSIHHIGSTSVRGLSAKPILDIAVVIPSFESGLKCVNPLEQLGYTYRGTDILPDRHYFNKGEPRTHQIHMYENNNKYLLEQLSFRDYLRNNETARLQYEELKRELVKHNNTNKHKYADDKTEFVKSILKKMNDENNNP